MYTNILSMCFLMVDVFRYDFNFLNVDVNASILVLVIPSILN